MVFDALLEWSHLAKIYSYDNAPEESTIIICQDSDLAPSHEISAVETENKHLLKMDASVLITNCGSSSVTVGRKRAACRVSAPSTPAWLGN
jgi:hypothetical protein